MNTFVNEQANKIIDIIKTMNEKDKLRLAICLTDSNMSNTIYDKKEIFKKADNRLQEIDEEYRTTIVNMKKYGSVLHTTAMITELPLEEQNRVTMFLINFIK